MKLKTKAAAGGARTKANKKYPHPLKR